MKINEKEASNNIFYKVYLAGFFLILVLPILVVPPYFFPPDWGKTIVFRSILAILLFLFIFQLIYKKNETRLPYLKRSKIFWLLTALFFISLLATLFSQDINFSLWGSPYRAGGAMDFFFYIIFAILSFLIIRPPDWNKALNISIFIGILVCFIAIIQFYGLFSNIFIPNLGRPPSTMGNPIMLGIYLLLLFFITLSCVIKEKRIIYRKLFYIFALSLFFLTILITGSRAAYLGLIFGGIYFFLFYPVKNKKLAIFKIFFLIILILGFFSVYYINSQKSLPQFLEKNKIFQAIGQRVSIELFLRDPRFSAWQVVLKAIKEKPIFGWGPENLAIGFDKYYDPSLPYISKAWGGWWDRAHNIVLDIASTTGISGLIAYLALFVVLFWHLQRLKYAEKNIVHGIQATLIGYFTANFFSFDSFSTYLIFFLLVGYSLHLISSNNTDISINQLSSAKISRNKYKKTIIILSFILLVLFLWQYNLIPFQINGQIQKANFLSEDKKCDQAFNIMNKILPQHSFLDAYSRIKYVEMIKICAEFYPEKNLEYAEKGLELMKEAIKIRPLYPRLWLFLGSFTTIKANAEQEPTAKKALLQEANSYFEKAKQLAPNHQEIIIEQAKTDMISGEYQAMKERAEKCILLDPSLGECYWIRALSKIYLKEFDDAKIDIQLSDEKRFDITTISSLHQLVNAYAAAENYKELALVYEKLIELRPEVAQYHSSLAFTYAKMGEYKKAREEALKFLQLMPEAKDEVDAFLRMLPH